MHAHAWFHMFTVLLYMVDSTATYIEFPSILYYNAIRMYRYMDAYYSMYI